MAKTSLEQWAAFKAVVDEGSYAKAAESLNKSQSSVSYAMARLQERLPSPLLILEGRKAELTDLGKSLYRHATNLLEQADTLDRTAEYLASGWAAEVVLAVNALVDMPEVFCALQQFSQEHPNTRIRILETTLSGTDEALLSRTADIVITPTVLPGFLGEAYSSVEMVPVASNEHTLASMSHISEGELKQHRQLVVRDSGTRREQDGGWLGAEQRWTVSHFSSSVDAIKAGLGFGFLPLHRIKQDLDQSTLKIIDLERGQSRQLALYLVLSDQSYTGPAARCVEHFLLSSVKKKQAVASKS